MKGTPKKPGHELAIEINFYPSQKDWDRLDTLLPKKYTYEDLTCTQEDIASFKRRPSMTPHLMKVIMKRYEGLVRLKYSKNRNLPIKTNIGVHIEKFLKGLVALKPMIAKYKGSLRLGIFFNLDKTVIFPVFLTENSIKQIADFNLSVTSISYPGQMISEIIDKFEKRKKRKE